LSDPRLVVIATSCAVCKVWQSHDKRMKKILGRESILNLSKFHRLLLGTTYDKLKIKKVFIRLLLGTTYDKLKIKKVFMRLS
jgi:hypothetical protein